MSCASTPNRLSIGQIKDGAFAAKGEPSLRASPESRNSRLVIGRLSN